MWRIFNWLFGWDYVYWQNSCDQGIARVRTSKNGDVYIYRYKMTGLIDKIHSPSSVSIWLTCSPDKYLNKSMMSTFSRGHKLSPLEIDE